MATDLLSPITRSAPMALRVIDNAEEAEALRSIWTGLLERAERNEITQSADWLLTWWRVFGNVDGRQLRLGLFHEGDRLVGLAPMLRRRHWYRGFLPFRRLELLASGEAEADAIVSNHIGILAERGAEGTVARRLVEAIADGAFGSWDEVVLPMMSGDTVMPELLVEAFRGAGYNAESMVTTGAPYIPLPDSWDAYVRGLTSGGKRSLKRAIKAFDKWSGGTTELECISTPAELEKGKDILMALHHERWSGESQGGVFRAPLFLAFHDRMMRTLAERGALELLVLKARGEPMAVLYTMVWDNKVSTYQTGRRTDMPAGNIKPGSVIVALAIRRAIEKGRREFDLLADEAFYKKQLTPHVRPLVQVRAARGCLVEWVRRAGVYCLNRWRVTEKKSEPQMNADERG